MVRVEKLFNFVLLPTPNPLAGGYNKAEPLINISGMLALLIKEGWEDDNNINRLGSCVYKRYKFGSKQI
jgi:hypothetical protein